MPHTLYTHCSREPARSALSKSFSRSVFPGVAITLLSLTAFPTTCKKKNTYSNLSLKIPGFAPRTNQFMISVLIKVDSWNQPQVWKSLNDFLPISRNNWKCLERLDSSFKRKNRICQNWIFWYTKLAYLYLPTTFLVHCIFLTLHNCLYLYI